MSKSKPSPQIQSQKPAEKKASPAAGVPKPFSIPFPLLWLMAAALVLYLPTISFGFTELDDSIFIKEFQAYNDDLSNLFHAFGRGLFSAEKDPYYRPLFSISMILNNIVSGTEIRGYHFVNVVLHMGVVALLFVLFKMLKMKQLHAFLLAALFAVLPVLCQAVAWVPGRNDELLAVFSLAFFIFCIRYVGTGVSTDLAASAACLLLALFTKETAVFVAPVAFVILVIGMRVPWTQKNLRMQMFAWAGCFAIWYLARAMATVHISTPISGGQIVADFFHRLPIIIQYIGKILLPFNLSVFPIQGDTVYYFGIAAVLILGALVALAGDVDWRWVITGALVFLMFLLPALIVPSNLNEQVFEHRLYLPVIGILIILSQSVLFKKLADKQLTMVVLGVALVFAVINHMHQSNFESPKAFWSQAVKTSPNSAYANMMLGARTDDLPTSYELFHKAYRLNPNEKYLNFYYGCMLQKRDSIVESEPYLLKEKKTSNYYECDFYLARVAITKRDTMGAMGYLKSYLKADPANPQANNNLLLMYFAKQQSREAKEQASFMHLHGLEVPGQMQAQLDAIHL